MGAFRTFVGLVVSCALLGSMAYAGEVTLRFVDGSIEISGELLGYDGEFFRVDSVFGELTLDGSVVSCAGTGCPDPETYAETLRFSGDRAAATVLLPALVEAFAARSNLSALKSDDPAGHTSYILSDEATGRHRGDIRISPSSTDEALADLVAGEADFALTFREPTKAETQRAREAGFGDISSVEQRLILALDAMVPVTSPRNRVEDISLSDLADVLSGTKSSWNELSGPDDPVVLHIPDDGSPASVQSLGSSRSSDGGGYGALAARRHALDADLITAVEGDETALGLISFSASSAARLIPMVDSCGHPTEVSVRSIKTEDYPFVAPRFLIVPTKRQPPLTRAFLEFVQSPAAQPVVRRAGFVDQTPDRIPLDAQGRRIALAIQLAGPDTSLRDLQTLVSAMSDTERLTTTFRFRDGSVELDAQSQLNLGLLASAIDRGFFDGRTLVFAGFSDARGAAAANRALSLRRAETVRDAIAGQARPNRFRRVEFEALGFGEAMPMACEDTALGQRVNRRVEVWVR